MKRIAALVLLLAACGEPPSPVAPPGPPPTPEQAAVLARIEAIRPKVEAVLGAPLGDLPEIVVKRREFPRLSDEEVPLARELANSLSWRTGSAASYEDREMDRLTVHREALEGDEARLETVLAGLLARRWITRRAGLEGASFESRPEDPFPRLRSAIEDALCEEVARRLVGALDLEPAPRPAPGPDDVAEFRRSFGPYAARMAEEAWGDLPAHQRTWGEFARCLLDAWGVAAACDEVLTRRTPTPREILHPEEYLEATARADPLHAAALAVRDVFPAAPAANFVAPITYGSESGEGEERPVGLLDAVMVGIAEFDPPAFGSLLLYRFEDSVSAEAYIDRRLREEAAFAAEVRAAPGGFPLREFAAERVGAGAVVRWRTAAENSDGYALLRSGVFVVDTGRRGPFDDPLPPLDLARRAAAAIEGHPRPELEDWQARWVAILEGGDVEAGLADPERRVQGRALHEIRMSDREALLPFEKLAPFLASPDRELRAEAHQMLAARVCDDQSTADREALAGALADPDAEVRKIALEALDLDVHTDPRFLEAAISGLSDPLTLVRRAAYSALKWRAGSEDSPLEGDALEAYERAKAEFE